MDEQQVTCPQCGREVADSLTWCPACGVELRAEPGAAAGEAADARDVTSAGRDLTASLRSPDLSPYLDDEFADEPDGWPASPDQAPSRPGTRPGPPPSASSAPRGGTAPDMQPAPVPSSSPRRSSVVLIIIVLGMLILAGLGAAVFFVADRSDGDTTEPAGDVDVNSLQVGQCWNDPESLGAESIEILEVPGVPCTEPHDNEVYALVDHGLGPDAAYPGDGTIEVDSFRACLQTFESYVGVPFAESPLDIYYVYPTATSWSAGDREIICSLYRLDEAPLVGSERNSELRLSTAAVDPSAAGDCAALADLTLELAQLSIDYFGSLSESELAGLVTLPEEAMPLVKGESLILARAFEVGCAVADLNALVASGASGLTSTTEFGELLIDDISQSGFFAEP